MGEITGRRDFRRLDGRLEAACRKEGAELSGLAVALLEGGELVHEACFGRRRIDPGDPSRDLPLDGDTKLRVASISKTFVAAAAMMLAERGLLDLEGDISPLLGFELRNPSFPDLPITPAMLLSHTSTLLDEAGYVFPLPATLSDALAPGGAAYDPARFAAPGPRDPVRPGEWFCYCNLNYGVLATAMEQATGLRFDRLMRELLILPLGLDASFNVLDFDDRSFGRIAPVYRKARDDSSWEPEGPWRPQVDDYREGRPACPVRLAEGLGPEALERYAPGSNGTLFSPQGGLRISPRDLAVFLGLLARGGEVGGKRLLSAASVANMTRPRWTWDPAKRNGELYKGPLREAGLGLFHGTGSRDAEGGDRLHPEGGPRLWGHHADAYGLLGGMLFDPASASGFLYLIGGCSVPPGEHRGRASSYFMWEEEIQTAIVEECPFWD